MNKKTQILHDALASIALATPMSAPFNLAQIATTALTAFAAFKEYRITARTWWSKSGGAEYRAELRNIETGNVMFRIQGCGNNWEYHMAKDMNRNMPDVFPPHTSGAPTIYFREVCGVDYEHREVALKRDL